MNKTTPHKLKNRMDFNLKKQEPLFPLLKAAAFTASCAATDMGICLSACANNSLASSLSFFSLEITRHAASCCKDQSKC